MNLKDFNIYIDSFIELLELIDYNNTNLPRIKNYTNMSFCITPGINSSITSLNALKQLIQINDFVDSYIILRKIRDNLLLDCVILQSCNINEKLFSDEYTNSFFDNNGKIDLKQLENTFKQFYYQNFKYDNENYNKNNINNWINNNEIDTTWIGYKQFSEYLSNNSNKIKQINLKYLNQYRKSLTQKLNGYVHSLSFIKTLNTNNLEEEIYDIIQSIKQIKIIFVSYMLLIQSNMFSSTDYIDALESGLTPEEGSQYFVAPLFEDTLKEIFTFNSDLYLFLSKNNVNNMNLSISTNILN